MPGAIDKFLQDTAPADGTTVPNASEETEFTKWYSGTDEAARLDLSVSTAVTQPPDTAAKILKLQAKTGLPEDLITRNVDLVDQESKRADFDPVRFQQTNPVVSGWMAQNPNHAAVVQDDVEAVTKLEDSVKDYGFGEMMWKSLNTGVARLDAGIMRLPALAYDVAAIPQNAFVKAIGKPDWQARSPEWLINNPAAKYYDAAAEASKPPELDKSIFEQAKAGDYSKAGRTLASQFVANAPVQAALIAATLSGVGVAGLVGAGALQAANVNKESRDRGAEPLQGAVNAVLQGTFEAAFERIGTFGILKHWEKAIVKTWGKAVSKEIWKDFAKTLAHSFAGEANEEFLTQIAQDWSDYITGVNPDAMKGTLTRAIDAGIVGGVSGAATTAPSAIVSGSIRGQEVRRAERAKNFYTALGETAEASKLRERLPEGQRSLIAELTKDSPVENVYIPVEAVEQYFQKANVNPVAAMQEIGALDAYVEAKDTGADVKIPLATWTDKVVGTPHYKALADDIKFSPEDMTVNQHKDLAAQIKAQEDAQQAAAAAASPAEESASEVGTAITEQLKTAGFDEATAGTYAKIYESAFKTFGERTGIDPAKLFEQFGLKIARQETPVPGPSMSQSVSLETFDTHYTPTDSTAEQVETAFVRDNLGAFETAYKEGAKTELKLKTPNYVSADLAKTVPVPGRSGFTAEKSATRHEGASAFAKSYYETLLKDESTKNLDVAVMAGGAGAGKTSGLKAQGKALNDFAAIYDTNLNSEKTGRRIIDAALATGRKVQVFFVDRNPVQAFKEGVYKRFRDNPEHRIVPIPAFMDTLKARDTVPKLAEFYKDNPNVQFTAFDNSGGRAEIKQIALEKLEKVAYNEDELRAQLTDFINEKQKAGEITASQAEAFTQSGDGLGQERPSGSSERVLPAEVVLAQSEKPGESRGMIRFGKDRQFNIDLLKKADLSTFLHETGHFYLEVLGDLATAKDAVPDIKADMDTILKWFDLKSRDAISPEHHEKFARAFEAYLMEGRAPSVGLRAAFTRFRAWLISIYRRMNSLDVKLTPEVRDVFDRMLASQDEINAARAQQSAPLFSDPASVGMSEAEALNYGKAVDEARRAAEEELSSKVMGEWSRQMKSWWKDERTKVRAEVEADVSQRKEYLALAVFQASPDAELPFGIHPFKLSKAAIIQDFPEFKLNNLPKPHVYAAEGGLHPDEAAAIFGFRSGAELLFNIETADPKDQLIDSLTDQRMKETHGDILNDGRLAVEAVRAVHNDKRAELLHKELQHLASNNLAQLKGIARRITRPVPPIQTVRAQAQQIIALKRVREITPSLYSRAEQRAGNEAVDAMLRGDFQAAFQAKQRELLNHELFRAASDASENVDKIVDYMKKFDKASVRERLGKAGEDYLPQIDAIIDRFDFRRSTSLRAIDKRKSLAAWIQDQQNQGFTVDVPPSVLNEAFQQHYKDSPYELLVGINDSVRSIEHLAQLKNKLLASDRAREMQAAREEIIASLGAFHNITPKPMEFAPGLKERAAERVAEGIATHTRMEFLFRWFDGNKPSGTMWEYFFKPMADAENVENDLRRNTSVALKEIFSAYKRGERADWFTKRIFIPDARTDRTTGTFTKANILALALNWGNAYNREALMEGYGWTEAQVGAVLDHLDERDWKTVQAIWDHLNSYWPQIAQQERELNGLVPEKVDALPVETKFGTFAGGYYPIVFDGKQSWRQFALDEAASVQEMFGGNWARAMTRHGHTIEREGTGGKPLLLDLTGMTNHLNGVIHDLSYRKAIIDVTRLFNDDEIKSAMTAAAGREMVKQLNPWLHAIAGDRPREYANAMEGILGRARMGATVVSLGLKVTSGLVQTLGYTLSVNELGPKYAARGLLDAFAHPTKFREKWNFITDRSQMMRDRIENYDRDVRDYARRPGLDLKDHAWFAFVGYMDLGTSIPTWLGAYQKALDGGIENVSPPVHHVGETSDQFQAHTAEFEKAATDYADMVVRTTQAAGAAKDLANVQRGGEAWRLFTMFYSSLSIQFNQFKQTADQFVSDRNVPKLIGSLALLWFLPAILEDVLRGRGPDDKDDDSWLKWLLQKELLYPFGTVVLVRDLASALERYITTGRKNFDGSPALAAGEAVVGTIGGAWNLATGEDVTRENVRDAVMTAGYFAQLPARQVWLTSEYLYDWMTGNEQPESPAEGLYRTLVTGKKKG